MSVAAAEQFASPLLSSSPGLGLAGEAFPRVATKAFGIVAMVFFASALGRREVPTTAASFSLVASSSAVAAVSAFLTGAVLVAGRGACQ